MPSNTEFARADYDPLHRRRSLPSEQEIYQPAAISELKQGVDGRNKSGHDGFGNAGGLPRERRPLVTPRPSTADNTTCRGTAACQVVVRADCSQTIRTSRRRRSCRNSHRHPACAQRAWAMAPG
jgi:hypothetical protein